MTKKTKQRVHFKPSHFKHHPIMGKVAVYYWSSKNACTAEGCSATFYLNGAEPDNPNHFAIKMFNTSVEAYAAFERQSLAAKDGLAPPVGHMAQFVYKTRIATVGDTPLASLAPTNCQGTRPLFSRPLRSPSSSMISVMRMVCLLSSVAISTAVPCSLSSNI